MSHDPTSQPEGPTLRARRKALGWSRRELAHRAGIDPRVVQLLELDQWSEGDARGRVRAVLGRAETGEADVQLPPAQLPEGSTAISAGLGGPVGEA